MRRMIICLIALFISVTYLFVPVRAYASVFDGAKEDACKGVAFDESASCGSVSAGGRDLSDVIKISLNIFSTVIGIIAVVMIMVGGVKYVMSQGDSNQVNSAKNTILYSVVGLVVAMLSQVIVKFVLNRFS